MSNISNTNKNSNPNQFDFLEHVPQKYMSEVAGALNQSIDKQTWLKSNLNAETIQAPTFETKLIHKQLINNSFKGLEGCISTIADNLNAPIEYITVSMLINLSTLIGNQIKVQPKKDDPTWLVTPNLWGLLIGTPSILKSPALKAIFKFIETKNKEYSNEFEEKSKHSSKQREILQLKIESIM
jgi:hypothetical protein